MGYVMPKYNRLTDNDKHFGPLTLGERSSHWRPFAVVVASGCEEYPGCSLSLSALGWTLRINLPQIIQPSRRWVDCSGERWAKSASSGYWDINPREFGFRLSDGFLQVFFGQQTHNSSTDQNWCTHLPWTQWRHVRESLYGLGGEEVWTQLASEIRGHERYEAKRAAQEACPKARFTLQDFDGTAIVATTHIEESELRKGRGWFKWVALFRKPRVLRSMQINFDKEVGYEKGSWKGGLTGHGIDLLPGELHEAAMRRYCVSGVRNKSGTSPLAFVGRA
jgi:hypothetical protein